MKITYFVVDEIIRRVPRNAQNAKETSAPSYRNCPIWIFNAVVRYSRIEHDGRDKNTLKQLSHCQLLLSNQ